MASAGTVTGATFTLGSATTRSSNRAGWVAWKARAMESAASRAAKMLKPHRTIDVRNGLIAWFLALSPTGYQDGGNLPPGHDGFRPVRAGRQSRPRQTSAWYDSPSTERTGLFPSP